MAATLRLEVVTPERQLLNEDVLTVEVPGLDGALGILPEHAPLISALGCGPLGYTTTGGQKKFLSICGGYVEVIENHVRILATHSENASDIDVQRAQEALKRAESRLASPTVELDVARALNAMKRAQARIEAAKLGVGVPAAR